MDEKPLIEDLLPHRGGMRLIDTIVAVDHVHAVTASTVKEEWPLIRTRGAGPLLLIELAAQTAGVCFGWNELKKPVEQRDEAKGWLVGVKKATFFMADLAMGARITIRTETVLVVDHYKEILAKAFSEENLMAEIQLQVLQAEQVS
jgi:predicted hotdog family 3-hydroxylacyl-ACP dehydratase